MCQESAASVAVTILHPVSQHTSAQHCTMVCVHISVRKTKYHVHGDGVSMQAIITATAKDVLQSMAHCTGEALFAVKWNLMSHHAYKVMVNMTNICIQLILSLLC